MSKSTLSKFLKNDDDRTFYLGVVSGLVVAFAGSSSDLLHIVFNGIDEFYFNLWKTIFYLVAILIFGILYKVRTSESKNKSCKSHFDYRCYYRSKHHYNRKCHSHRKH